jgi:cyclase
MGDDFVRYGFPFIDVASGGSVLGMIVAMEKVSEKVSAQLPADVRVIPGQGAISNLDEVRENVKMLREMAAVVQKALSEHKTLEQMEQEKILEPWKKWSGEHIDSDKFIETLYNSLTGKKGEFVKAQLRSEARLAHNEGNPYFGYMNITLSLYENWSRKFAKLQSSAIPR